MSTKKAETKKTTKKATTKKTTKKEEVFSKEDLDKAVKEALAAEKKKADKKIKEKEKALEEAKQVAKEKEETIMSRELPRETSINQAGFNRKLRKEKKVGVVVPRTYSTILGSRYEFALNGNVYTMIIDGKTKNELPETVAEYWQRKLTAILDNDFPENRIDTIFS